MIENSPNKGRIDSFENRIQERFNHDEMEDWTLQRLHEARWLLENEFTMFKSSFPPRGGLEGPMRAFAHDNSDEEMYSLTNDELLRIRHIKRSALSEINRAEGKRKDKNREHRLKIYNTAIDFTSSVGGFGKEIAAVVLTATDH